MQNTDQTIRTPALYSQHREFVPTALLRAMFMLAFLSLVIVCAAVAGGRPPVAQPELAAVVREKWVVLEGLSAQAVIVRNTDGSVLLDLPHGGFITVVQSSVFTERRKHNVDQTLPVRIVEYANGRLAAEDPVTGWSVELYAFGGDNKAAFVRLLDQE